MGNQRFRPYGLYRFIAFLFGLTKFKSIDFLDEHFELNFKNGSNSIKYTQVMEVKSGGIFFKRFRFICPWKTYTFKSASVAIDFLNSQVKHLSVLLCRYPQNFLQYNHQFLKKVTFPQSKFLPWATKTLQYQISLMEYLPFPP